MCRTWDLNPRVKISLRLKPSYIEGFFIDGLKVKSIIIEKII